MARSANTNYTGGTVDFQKATATNDPFLKEDVQKLAEALDTHDHQAGLGLGVRRVQTSVAPSVAGQVRVNTNNFQWYGSGVAAVVTAVDDTNVQTVAGVKTFTSTTVFPAGVTVTGNSTVTGTLSGITTLTAATLVNATHTHQGASTGGTLANAAHASDTARFNLLVNGGFEIAQRGTGAFTINGVYTMDRWQIGLATSTVSISQITSTIASKGKSAQVTYTHAGGGSLTLQQVLKCSAAEFLQLQGKTITLSIKVKSNVIGTIRSYINDDVSGTTLGSLNATTAEESLTVTATISATAATITLGVLMAVATATVEVNDAMLVIGTIAADYAPLTPADEMVRCARYYRVYSGVIVRSSSYVSGAAISKHFDFGGVVLPAVPTVTKAGTWLLTSITTQPSVANVTTGGFELQTQSNAVAATVFFNADSADDVVTVEANP